MSAAIVAIPEAERLVSAYRQSLDRSAGWGVPAHVTVLFPFLRPDRLDDDVVAALEAAVRTVPQFEVALASVRWFGEHLVWLAPEPDEPFRALTAAVFARFPECPPYEGAHPDVTPHLTMGQDHPVEDLVAAAEAILPSLPIRA